MFLTFSSHAEHIHRIEFCLKFGIWGGLFVGGFFICLLWVFCLLTASPASRKRSFYLNVHKILHLQHFTNKSRYKLSLNSWKHMYCNKYLLFFWLHKQHACSDSDFPQSCPNNSRVPVHLPCASLCLCTWNIQHAEVTEHLSLRLVTFFNNAYYQIRAYTRLKCLFTEAVLNVTRNLSDLPKNIVLFIP